MSARRRFPGRLVAVHLMVLSLGAGGGPALSDGLLFREPEGTCSLPSPERCITAVRDRMTQLAQQAQLPLTPGSLLARHERWELLLLAAGHARVLTTGCDHPLALTTGNESSFLLYSGLLLNHVEQRMQDLEAAVARALQAGSTDTARRVSLQALALTAEWLDLIDRLSACFPSALQVLGRRAAFFAALASLRAIVQRLLLQGDWPALAALDMHLGAALRCEHSVLVSLQTRIGVLVVALDSALELLASW